jgi:hypothetical protein
VLVAGSNTMETTFLHVTECERGWTRWK